MEVGYLVGISDGKVAGNVEGSPLEYALHTLSGTEGGYSDDVSVSNMVGKLEVVSGEMYQCQ